jgi:hypothetical protein
MRKRLLFLFLPPCCQGVQITRRGGGVQVTTFHVAFKGVEHGFADKRCKWKSRKLMGLHHQILQNTVNLECCLQVEFHYIGLLLDNIVLFVDKFMNN